MISLSTDSFLFQNSESMVFKSAPQPFDEDADGKLNNKGDNGYQQGRLDGQKELLATLLGRGLGLYESTLMMW